MIQVHFFTFNPFSENTYILSDETRECIIIDPGCYSHPEKRELADYIQSHQLQPKLLLLTHAHLDHVLGCAYVNEMWNLTPQIHQKELVILHALKLYADLWGINPEPVPDPEVFFEEGDKIKFGNSTLDILSCPGHSPGHVVFVPENKEFVIGGDVLFNQSIGRTDLPGGDYDSLISSIKTKLLNLPDSTIVYSGHGPETTIGAEREYNPFLVSDAR